MKISHYFEFEDHITGGIRESVKNQRKMLRRLGIDQSMDPHLDSDALHLNLMGPRSVWYAKRARTRGVPVIAHTHVTAEDFGDSFRFTNALAKPLKPYLERVYGLADALICPSEYNRRLIEEYTDTPTTVISNGVDREKLAGFAALESEYRERYDLSEPTVFAVGHVLKRKGLETFVETARRMPELDFAWFGPLDRSLKGRETKRLIDGSPENCTFTGYVEDIRGAYAAGDVFFFPTHEENEGIALLEAMSTGHPAVVRDIETFSWLTDGEDCLKTAGSFERELEALKDPERREELGTNAARTSDSFALPETARQLEAVYEAVV
ncbi:glycosyltransferase family 4 protein [Halalkalicoccus jeotgali]|uniref:Glycosyl transferase group 1 n=1 Tax=Halalkalicoccus jeotgali (strain DSM 18796 / CECT 7217 / JCM 14584 / KCTC 4019 / B3) TaxID=795797 RepID=D8J886_HALJB|nr:glycosyltransferase family 4 protein [Halalkalicoccus jeotgali]ADJ14199.1 glycosyl transferase group 1 [Halalkalicoccus jeotgali B3]ELY34619.1 group 1 glycosyl transferase [Halalkalicoccus jeotgali B3]